MPPSTDSLQEPATPRAPHVPGQYPSSPPPSVVASQRTLARAVHERRHDFLKPQSIRIKIGTWNVAALPGTEKDLAAWFAHGKGLDASLAGLNLKPGPEESIEHQEGRQNPREPTAPAGDQAALPSDRDVGLYVLGLQEIVDIASPTNLMYTDPNSAVRWKDAAQAALPEGFYLAAEQQLMGLLLLVYAAPTVARPSVSTTYVGTGLMGSGGNKGAVAARVFIGGDTRLVFICSHLGAGADPPNLIRRNWDADKIVSQTSFDPVEEDPDSHRKEVIGDEDAAFWFGDLNYRLDDIPGDDVRRLLLRHTRDVYEEPQKSLEKINNELRLPADSVPEHEHVQDSGVNSMLKSAAAAVVGGAPSANDPDSLQTTLASLLPHDQLHDQMRRRKAFHEGWQEGPLRFLPTYKYDVGSVGMFDSSEKHRSPSWCDRILYRTKSQLEQYRERATREEASRSRDQQMKAGGHPNGDDVIFDYDPETDGDEGFNEDHRVNETKDLAPNQRPDEHLNLEYYSSHQRVLSSDHKPITAVFKLDYHAEDPDLKSKISAEVAKALDKAENESRPGVTVDVEGKESDESINFGKIRHGVPQSRMITVANTSQVQTTFKFIFSDGDTTGEHPWLSVDFVVDGSDVRKEHTLDPGDTIQARITVHLVALDDVRRLNKGEPLEDVLILRVQGGRDHFLPIHAQWLPTCFGMSLDELSRFSLNSPEQGGGDRRSVAPKQLLRLGEALEVLLERAIAEWGMKGEVGKPPWEASGWPFADNSWVLKGKQRADARRMVVQALDDGSRLEYPVMETYEKAEVLAETMVRFVNSIDGGIVSDELWSQISHALHEDEKSKHETQLDERRALVMETLAASPASSAAFTYVVFTLARIVSELAPLHLQSSAPSTPRTADGLLRRARGLSQDPVIAKRREVERAYASIFAQAIFNVALPSKLKDQKGDVERRKEVIRIFLHSGDFGQ